MPLLAEVSEQDSLHEFYLYLRSEVEEREKKLAERERALDERERQLDQREIDTWGGLEPRQHPRRGPIA